MAAYPSMLQVIRLPLLIGVFLQVSCDTHYFFRTVSGNINAWNGVLQTVELRTENEVLCCTGCRGYTLVWRYIKLLKSVKFKNILRVIWLFILFIVKVTSPTVIACSVDGIQYEVWAEIPSNNSCETWCVGIWGI